MGAAFVNGVTQDKIGSHDYHTMGSGGGMLTDETAAVLQLLVVDTNSSNEYHYSEVPLDSFAHHNKKHISKVTKEVGAV